MAIALKQIMLVTRNVQFAIDLKRALEALGTYGVTTVADVRNAVEQFREYPQQLVLLDISELSISPAILIEMLRARQDDIAIVLAPDRPESHRLLTAYQLQGVVDIPVMARALLPVLEAALQDRDAAMPLTDVATALPAGEDTVAIESLVDDILSEHSALNYTRRRLQASFELLHPRSEYAAAAPVEVVIEADDEGDTVRYRYVQTDDAHAATTMQMSGSELADTPVAGPGESETVRDLAQSVVEGRGAGADQSLAVPAALEPDADGELGDDDAFQNMLSRVLDESTALDNLTLESLFDTTRELPGALGTGVVPAWIKETEKFIQEPEFLHEFLPSLENADSPGETTAPTPLDPATLETEPAEARSAENDQAHETDAKATVSAGGLTVSPVSSRDDDPYLAQLALTMTQMMGNVAVEATVLARDNRIVAYSGPMEVRDFRDLRAVIGDDWAVENDKARIRFVRLPDSGADYMLHSRGTMANLTLTMIFAGGKKLSDIRRQADSMLAALAAATDDDARPATVCESPGAADPADARQPFAFVWLISDPALLLQKPVADQLVFWLEVQLNSLGWTIYRLDVHQDFIYLRADAPGRASPDRLVRTVMERAQRIACSEDSRLPQDLWADAYLVLQPGREMSERELERFLQFVRV